MGFHTDTTTSESLTESLEYELELEAALAAANRPKVRSTSSQIVGGVKRFYCYVLAAVISISVYTLAFDQTSQSTKAADWFLWACGSDLTWNEYQRRHIAKGHRRLKGKDKTWIHQFIHDGLSGNNH